MAEDSRYELRITRHECGMNGWVIEGLLRVRVSVRASILPTGHGSREEISVSPHRRIATATATATASLSYRDGDYSLGIYDNDSPNWLQLKHTTGTIICCSLYDNSSRLDVVR